MVNTSSKFSLAGHRAVPRENELDFLAEAEADFLTPKATKKAPKPKKEATSKKQPTALKPAKAPAKKAKPGPAAFAA